MTVEYYQTNLSAVRYLLVTLFELGCCAGKPLELRYSEGTLAELRSFAVILPVPTPGK
jgi:hypothetical protein